MSLVWPLGSSWVRLRYHHLGSWTSGISLPQQVCIWSRLCHWYACFFFFNSSPSIHLWRLKQLKAQRHKLLFFYPVVFLSFFLIRWYSILLVRPLSCLYKKWERLLYHNITTGTDISIYSHVSFSSKLEYCEMLTDTCPDACNHHQSPSAGVDLALAGKD